MTDKTQTLLPVTPELLPCPFCGGPAELRQEAHHSTGAPLAEAWFAICGPCDLIRDQAWSVPRDTAIEQWNTRSQSHSLPGDVGMREAAQAVLDNADRPGSRMCFGGGPNGEDIWVDHKEVDQHLLDALAAALTPSAPQWNCAARKSNTGASDPQDCNWPVCGCDPLADKVVAALDEMGLLAAPSALSGDAGEGERLRAALTALLARDMRNTCRHEETYRGGTIWEICTYCGTKWADDEGGKPDWVDPPEWVAALAALPSHQGAE